MAKNITIISTTADLTAFCEHAATVSYITIDTEFLRERTYYPKLCLIQVSTGEQAVIIDPLADGISLDPLTELLNNEAVLKVFHAARQDLEIFYHLTGKVPHPIFDTQVAAMVCGFGESISYDNLVQQLADATLDKSARFTNWEQRPLTDKQLVYALADVTYLRTIYDKLLHKLEANGRVGWITEEMAVLTDPITYAPHPEDAWKRLKIRTRKPQFLNILQAVAEWRERTAQERDIPRGRLLKDDTLTNIAASAPKNPKELQRMRGMNKGLDKKLMEALADVIDNARQLPKSAAPALPTPIFIPPTANAAIELLRVLLKRQCDSKGVAQKLVANRSDLDQIAIGNLKDSPVSHGWRWEVFGKYAADLMKGELALALEPEEGAVILLTHEDMEPESA